MMTMTSCTQANAEAILKELATKITAGIDKLNNMKGALVGVTASASKQINMELVTGLCLRMRKQMADMYKRVEEKEEEEVKNNTKVSGKRQGGKERDGGGGRGKEERNSKEMHPMIKVVNHAPFVWVIPMHHVKSL